MDSSGVGARANTNTYSRICDWQRSSSGESILEVLLSKRIFIGETPQTAVNSFPCASVTIFSLHRCFKDGLRADCSRFLFGVLFLQQKRDLWAPFTQNNHLQSSLNESTK